MPSLLTVAKALTVPDGFQGYFFFRPLAFLVVAGEVLLHVLCALPLLLVVYIPIGLALPHIEFELGQQRYYGGLLARDPEAAEFWYLRAAKPGLLFWEEGHASAAYQLANIYASDQGEKAMHWLEIAVRRKAPETLTAAASAVSAAASAASAPASAASKP